jgi:hypothetical protein
MVVHDVEMDPHLILFSAGAWLFINTTRRILRATVAAVHNMQDL